MEIFSDLLSFPIKLNINTLHSLEHLPLEADINSDKVAQGNNLKEGGFDDKSISKEKRNMILKDDKKESYSDSSSGSDFDSRRSSESIIEIGECSYLDDAEAEDFISSDINEKSLKKFLQRERVFYNKAFPQAILSRKSPDAQTRL